MGGGTPDTRDPQFWVDGSIPWVSPKDMKTFEIGQSIDSVSAAALARLTLVPSESVLVVVRSGILSRVLPVAVNTVPVTINQDMRAFVPHAGLDARFLAWQLVSRGNDILTACAKDGTTVASIEGSRLASFEIAVAPAAQQQRIVDLIEELTSDLDAGVAELKAAQRKLQQYRQSLLKTAVEGALTADWRARNPPQETGAELLARILRERRARWESLQEQRFERVGKTPPPGWRSDYVQPATPVATGLPQLPVGWVWASLDQLLVSVRSGTAATSSRQPTDHPVLKSSAVRQGSIDFNALNYLDIEQSKRDDNYLELGDLLITRLSGSLGYVGCCAVVLELPAARVQYPDRIFCGKPVVPDRCLTALIAMSFQAPVVRSLIEVAAKSTAGHKRISLSDLPMLPIALPPVSEIAAIIELVESATSASVVTEVSVQAGLRLAAAQRQNILRAAFAGQLVPQDPADEPASALLARIHAERAAAARPPKPSRRTKTKASA